MKKQILTAIIALSVAGTTWAKDALDGSVWQTIDDKTGKAKATVVFNESNGRLNAKIKSLYDPAAKNKTCLKCSGAQKNKPIVGLNIVSGLKPDGKNSYSGGTILDPESGKSYKLNGSLSSNGKVLKLRGYIGVSALGRNQVWKRIK